MIKIKPLVVALILVSLSFGCSNDTHDKNSLTKEIDAKTNKENIQIEFVEIVSEKSLPTNFDDIAFQRETTPLHQFLVRKTVNQSEFEQAWKLYRLENNIPNIDFKEKDVFFIGVHESGSCPYSITNVEMSTKNNTMTVPLSEPGGDCTADATPRTFVIKIDKRISKDMENIVIVQSGVETNVPFKN